MLSMLKMDIRRLLKNKYLYISICVFVLIMGICIYSQNDAQIIHGFQTLPQEHEVGISSWIDYFLNIPLHFMYGFATKYIMLIFGIFIISFTCNEFNSGFIKNSCMMYKNRNMIAFNKFFMAIFLSVFTALLAVIVSFVFGSLFIEQFEVGNVYELMSYTGVMIVVNIAYFSLLTFICFLTKNKTIGIVIALLVTMGLTSAIFETVFGLFKVSELTNYTLSKITMSLPMLYDKTLTIRALLMSGIFVLLYNVLNVLLINKKDI